MKIPLNILNEKIDFDENVEHRIIVIGYSLKHLMEFYKSAQNSVKLLAILDDNPRKHGTVQVLGHQVKVAPIKELPEFYEEGCNIVIMDDYYMEIYDALVENTFILKHFDTIYCFLDMEARIYQNYLYKYRNIALQNIIVFRSGPHASQYVSGMDYGDNARALFEYMLSVGLNRKYKLIWFVKSPEEFSEIERNNENVYFYSFDWSTCLDKDKRDAYYEALCLSKYIFMTDAYGFCRYPRKGQIRVQLWHGCGFKTRTTFSRCEKRYEYNIVVSPAYAKVHQKIYGLRENQVLLTGYPKVDWLFHPVIGWKEMLGIPDATKYIFWMPTLRTAKGQLSELNEKAPFGESGLPIVTSMELINEINDLLVENECILIVKLHPFQDEVTVKAEGFSNIIVLSNDKLNDLNLQINQILGMADALISDYSSTAIDFLALDRPIAFTLDDVEKYEQSRGFVFFPIEEYLPGTKIYNFNDFENFLRNILSGNDIAASNRQRLRKYLQVFEDDRNSKRVIDMLGIV